MIYCHLINSGNESSTNVWTEDKFLYLCVVFKHTLSYQVVPSAYSTSIVSYNLLWELSLRWGLVSKRPVPADCRSVTLLRTYLCRHSRRVVIHCHYAIVVPCTLCIASVINHLRSSRILSRLFIYPVYFTFDYKKTSVSERTLMIFGNFKTLTIWDHTF